MNRFIIMGFITAVIFFNINILFAENNINQKKSEEDLLSNNNFSYLNYSKAERLFNAPEKRNFKNYLNKKLITKHKPHHNGYDKIFNKDETKVLKAKFQYGDFRKDLQNESVIIFAFSFKESNQKWIKLGEKNTDDDGIIKYIVPKNQNLQIGMNLIRFYVKGDGSIADSFIQVIDKPVKYVVFDIDGTLTVSDKEISKEYVNEILNENYSPKMYEGANKVCEYYLKKGYKILYLSARPNWLLSNSRTWLREKDFPLGILHTHMGADILLKEEPFTFKRDYLLYLKSKGVEFAAVYGNALTDIKAYEKIGIDKLNTFIIGKHAGKSNTVIVKSYLDHLFLLNSLK